RMTSLFGLATGGVVQRTKSGALTTPQGPATCLLGAGYFDVTCSKWDLLLFGSSIRVEPPIVTLSTRALKFIQLGLPPARTFRAKTLEAGRIPAGIPAPA